MKKLNSEKLEQDDRIMEQSKAVSCEIFCSFLIARFLLCCVTHHITGCVQSPTTSSASYDCYRDLRDHHN